MRQTKPRGGKDRVTRGFTIDAEAPAAEPPRKVRTRAQIISGEGRRPPAAVPLDALAHNPFNPRSELSEIEETAESLRTRGQIQPVTVARRQAFLAAHSGQEEALGEAEYVVIDGNRRLAAAHHAGLDELRIDVNDELAASATDLLETALIANVHRVDVPPLDQAQTIQQLVGVHGSQGKVAKRLGKTPAWVSQRLALLELTPDLQSAVETGELRVEPARRIGRLPKAEQAPAAQAAMAASKAPRQRAPRRQLGSGSEGPTVNGVNGSSAPGGGSKAPQQTINAVNTPAAMPLSEASVAVSGVSPETIVAALTEQLSPQDLARVAELLLEALTTSATR
ncbi:MULTISPECIES: ParB/RepB/Spo0J family partition protein [unclassified Streptomyces]|uniref:ParB/RepB/Spo0J family partition protein n=1 Tax=unclassified Streptomyces TaxID=2593676 RepID=UPI00081E8ACA|nr:MULTISPECIES: ParB/RepB/Spo0J family partition protein [unclassified Streptomyces]MYR27782.1 ParB/RepB/Spo0J family partition protein [Streptomyces sp. SID4945]SCF29309.1 chromosome partitioning protein, ParB family [Streptomyces sp. LcepLS]